jgi:23S rRNA (cytidine1920-2'-O)/16S rRNA (cytidine1409-2'-O)-methyltransferase
MERLDKEICNRYNISSRSKAQSLIKDNLVLLNGKLASKASCSVSENDVIEILEHKDYVSRGAHKLLRAIDFFKLDFFDKVVLDIGASTGGFTQVCIENGAKKVYSVDIGKDELDKSLRENPKVVNMAGMDFRDVKLEQVEDVDIIVGDLSFISLTKILPKISELFLNEKEMILLFKPQFECGKEIAKKYKGIIKNKEIHEKLLKNIEIFAKNNNFLIKNITFSSIQGGDGNIEYLLYFSKKQKDNYNIDNIVEQAFSYFK